MGRKCEETFCGQFALLGSSGGDGWNAKAGRVRTCALHPDPRPPSNPRVLPLACKVVQSKTGQLQSHRPRSRPQSPPPSVSISVFPLTLMTAGWGLLLGLGFSGVTSCPHTDLRWLQTEDCSWVWVSLVLPPVHTQISDDCRLRTAPGSGFLWCYLLSTHRSQMTVDCGLFWVWVSLVFPCVHTETLRWLSFQFRLRTILRLGFSGFPRVQTQDMHFWKKRHRDDAVPSPNRCPIPWLVLAVIMWWRWYQPDFPTARSFFALL